MLFSPGRGVFSPRRAELGPLDARSGTHSREAKRIRGLFRLTSSRGVIMVFRRPCTPRLETAAPQGCPPLPSHVPFLRVSARDYPRRSPAPLQNPRRNGAHPAGFTIEETHEHKFRSRRRRTSVCQRDNKRVCRVLPVFTHSQCVTFTPPHAAARHPRPRGRHMYPPPSTKTPLRTSTRRP